MSSAHRRYYLGILIFGLFTPTYGLDTPVRLGLENLLSDHLDLIAGKKLGVIANQTSLDSKGIPIVELLAKSAKITVIFGLEHGFRGNTPDGVSIQNTEQYGMRIYSLYGAYRSPTTDMLKDVEVLIYDIQDVGVKFYTYISSLYLCLRAAQREGIPMIVLDRPNPINAAMVEGPVTNPAYGSFVGVVPLPIRYGMTVGELAQLFNHEPLLGHTINADLTVIEMTGYRRNQWYDETGLPWTPTSPNMPTLETALVYPGMCLLEGTNLSEGRGTESPFLTFGAPFIDPTRVLQAVPQAALSGLQIEAVSFTPHPIPNKVDHPKWNGKKCQGFHLQVKDRKQLHPIASAVAILCAIQKCHPKDFRCTQYMDSLWGNEELRSKISAGADYLSIIKSTEMEVKQFMEIRNKYLRYE